VHSTNFRIIIIISYSSHI